MKNARRQAENISNKTNKGFREMEMIKVKGTPKANAKLFAAHIIISIIIIKAIIVFSVIGLCS